MRVGTRGSALALAQARWVAARLGPEAEIVTITTAGDRGAAEQDKSRWTGELERALLDDRIDVAVHSAKDVPAELGEGLALVAVPPRADARDVLCGARSLSDLAPGARVGTSSLRREAQLRASNATLDIVPIRGNVDTRLRKLRGGECDALVLARAGLERLGLEDEVTAVLDEFVPAAGQGALALQARAELQGDARLEAVRDSEAECALAVERELVRRLGASCHTPIGIHAVPQGELVKLRAWIGLPDGGAWLSDQLLAAAHEAAGLMAQRLQAAGAAELLAEAERAA